MWLNIHPYIFGMQQIEKTTQLGTGNLTKNKSTDEEYRNRATQSKQCVAKSS